jgi:hypothetical protein
MALVNDKWVGPQYQVLGKPTLFGSTKDALASKDANIAFPVPITEKGVALGISEKRRQIRSIVFPQSI